MSMDAARTPHTLANLIRMTRSGAHNGSFCIVEGEDDRKFYKRFLDSSQCKIFVAGGWENVVKSLRILADGSFAGVLGIVDADFGRLENRRPELDNLFWTDLRDLEMMLVTSSAFKKVVGELCDEDRLREATRDSLDFLSVLLKASSIVGCFRWLNHTRGFRLRFKGIKFTDFIDKNTLRIDPDRLIKAVKDNSNRHDVDTKNLLAEIQTVEVRTDQLPLICRGHDVVELLSIALRKFVGKCQPSEITPELLESRLRVAYEQAEFECSELFKSLLRWESENDPLRVLPSSRS